MDLLLDDNEDDELPQDGVDGADEGSDESIDTSVEVDDKDEIDYTDPEQNKSARDSIRNALKQVKEDTGEDDETKPDKPVKKVDKVDTPVEHDEKVPTSWDETAKKNWNKLPKEVVKAIAKREKEIDNGFAQIQNHVARIKEFDKVLAPRQEAIRGFGAPEAQVIDTLFQWMEGLSNPAKSVETAKQLLSNFKIDLSKLAPITQATNPDADDPPTPAPIDIENHPAFVGIKNQLNQFIGQTEQQKKDDAKKSVDAWASDKTHLEKVRAPMAALLQSGQYTKADGTLDLDGAYQAACYAIPETRTLLIAEEKAAADAKKKLDDANLAKARQAKADKARKAGSSLKTSAPTLGSNVAPKAKVNGNKPVSARDSIRAAIHEVQNAD